MSKKKPPKSGVYNLSPQDQQVELDPTGAELAKHSAAPPQGSGNTETEAEALNSGKLDTSPTQELVTRPVLPVGNKVPSQQVQQKFENSDGPQGSAPPFAQSSQPPSDSKSTVATGDLSDADEPPIKKRRGPSGGYYLECFLREVLTNMRHNPMMSIASVSTVMVLALILGLFVLIIANLESLADELAGEMQIKVYMDSQFTPDQINSFKSAAYDIGHVSKVSFVPKDEAFKKLRQRLNAKLDLSDLDGNPLPDAFEVPVDDPTFLEPVAHKLAGIDHVATVDYGREEAQKLMKLNHVVRIVGLVILVMLLASTLLIISNTIRLTVFARRKEIDIMQLVGAADWFIRWPFILEGITQGMVGAALATLLIDVSYRMVVPQLQRSISFLPILLPTQIMPFINVGLITMGCLVGALGSFISVNRYLKA
ncbi:MAG: permease-like cell division protein FtsX [bacterium]|nr:permease-like cell division protein FtsX [bacterium]